MTHDRRPVAAFLLFGEAKRMLRQLVAFGVHAFTALGVVFGFQALLEAAAHRWEAAFAWLGLALIVDGLDGPLARYIGVTEKLPRFSGERLDLIIDYTTYVVVPAYIIYEAKLVPPELATTASAIILLASLFHFTDRKSKTEDGFFVGFPALWNVVALYFFIFAVPQKIAFVMLTLFALLTFIPFKWIHPVRVRKLRLVTFAVMGIWSVAVISACADGFPASVPTQIAIALSTLYLLGLGVIRSLQQKSHSLGSGSK